MTRQRLFSSPFNSCVSIIYFLLALYLLPQLLSWAILDANWSGSDRESCTNGGACWIYIKVHINQFLFGFYPPQEYWRPITCFVVLLGSLSLFYIPSRSFRKILSIWLFIFFPVIGFYTLYGTVGMLTEVETRLWGGALLTLIISLSGMVFSLPAGVLLALGRRSDLPIIRTTCTIFIEFWRGVPLITVLFMSSVMFPLLLPEGMTFNKLLRALLAVSLFSSAYMAEVIRGGLQALPSGQYEAGFALGLGYWKSHFLVILPQALRAVIPGIANTLIGLFKDTTLVTTIGMLDLLGVVQATSSHPDWLGYSLEGYLFAGLYFWLLCLILSRYSIKLEHKLSKGHS